MLWAIDVGNTHTVFGLWDGIAWIAQWRLTTAVMGTEDELAGRLASLCRESGIPFEASHVVIASVNPFADENLERLAREWLHVEPVFLRTGAQAGIEVTYHPPEAVGADRIANAIGALEIAKAPIIVVDFGTATTFDCIDAQGRYTGGAILPGPETLMDALTTKTAKLPRVPLKHPEHAVGKSTAESLQSGLVLGYVGAIEHLLTKIKAELGDDCTVMSTGGLGGMMAELTPMLSRWEPTLTLDGLRLFLERSL